MWSKMGSKIGRAIPQCSSTNFMGRSAARETVYEHYGSSISMLNDSSGFIGYTLKRAGHERPGGHRTILPQDLV